MNDKNINTNKKDQVNYGYYSKVLKEPFDSLQDLKAAEEAYMAKQKAKEEKAAEKKNDAKRVENAFKDLNAARKHYKQALVKLTEEYAAELKTVKEAFEKEKETLNQLLADCESAYSATLKEFTDKYPEGFHLTLKDGDFETTISSNTVNKKCLKYNDFPGLWDLFNVFYF